MESSLSPRRPTSVLERALGQRLHVRVWPPALATIILVGDIFHLSGTVGCMDQCFQRDQPIVRLERPELEAESTVSVAPPATMQSAYSTGTIAWLRSTGRVGGFRGWGRLST